MASASHTSGLHAPLPWPAQIGEDGHVIEMAVMDAEPLGTAAYRAPEVYHQPSHSPLKLDVWALGIVTFSLVSGFFPMEEAKDTDRRFRKLAADQREVIGVCESTFKTYKQQHLNTFSPALKSLIDGMLTIDYATRLSVKEVEGHPWITNEPAWPVDAFQTDC
jgi:serine/threonine protein kinase